MSNDNQMGVGQPSNPLFTTFIAFISRFKWILELFRTPMSAVGTVVVLIFFGLALFGSNIAAFEYDEDTFSNFDLLRDTEPDCFSDTSIKAPLLGIKSRLFDPIGAQCDHPFGTDHLGRDVFSRVILGTREIFRLAGFGTLFAVIVGTAIGLFIGYRGGMIDEIIGRFLDSLLSMPALLLALILVGTLPQNPLNIPYPSISLSPLNFEFSSFEIDMVKNSLLVVLMIVYAPIVARVVRSNVLSIKTRGFVEAAQLRGESTLYILGREILPSVIPALVVEASLRFSYAIFLVASLGFLGLGSDPTVPNWGRMVSEAYNDQDFTCNEFQCTYWNLLYPVLAIVLLVVSVNLMSDGIKRLVQRNE